MIGKDISIVFFEESVSIIEIYIFIEIYIYRKIEKLLFRIYVYTQDIFILLKI